MKRILSGILIIMLGLAILLANINVFSFRDVLTDWWPLFVIGAGAIMAFGNRENYLWGLLAGGLGIVFLINNLDVAHIRISDIIFPALLVTIGLQVLVQSRSRVPEQTSSTRDEEDVIAILGGTSHKNTSDDYRSAKITAILGGTETDISKVTIKKSATINLLVVMGGIELRVPENVIVKPRAGIVLAGIEDKTSPNDNGDNPILYLDGIIVMGGVEIKR